jgi:hypothetical protein
MKHSLKSSGIKKVVQNSLQALKDIDINVKAIVLDQESTQRLTFKSCFGVTPSQPWIHEDSCESQKIYVVWDPPHLLKNIRNNLKKHHLKVFKLFFVIINSFL